MTRPMTQPGCIAVLNAGSSSIKFALYEAGRDGALLFRGQVERLGLEPRLRATNAAGDSVAERTWPAGGLDHRSATNEIIALGRQLLAGRPVLAFGHRVVHGGLDFAQPARIDADVLAKLARLVPLAPLHAAQPRADRGHRRGGAASPPGRLLRHRVPSQPAAYRAGLRPAARAQRRRRSPLRLPRPVVRLHREPPARDGARDCPIAPDHRPSRQRRQPVRRAGRQERRQHHGVHGRRRPDDGHAHGLARPRRAALPHAGARPGRRRHRGCALPSRDF